MLFFIILSTIVFGEQLQARQAQAIVQGRVIAVSDGDTLRILTPQLLQMTIRLSDIDAPESHQPYGAASKRELSQLVFGKTVSATIIDVDRYGRRVACLSVGRTDVNAEMVRRGAAWAYVAYLHDPRFIAFEKQARRGQLGLWHLQPNQIQAPWLFRQEARSKGHIRAVRREKLLGPLFGQSMTCGTKRFCAQMTSCKEAVFYLRKCGLSRLDGDRDGKPCEKLCG